MLGIPVSGTSEATNFWISFWAALYSGAIYSILTGMIVGIAICRIQLGSESRRKKYESERISAIEQFNS